MSKNVKNCSGLLAITTNRSSTRKTKTITLKKKPSTTKQLSVENLIREHKLVVTEQYEFEN